MRELKFRAWDKLTKKYYAVSGLEFDENGELYEVYLAGIPTTDLNENVREPSDVIIEQCTDLKDKNDKEIYEGDIAKCGPYSGKPIVFEDGRYWLGEEPDDLFVAIVRWGIRVIGNVHENPELLEEEK